MRFKSYSLAFGTQVFKALSDESRLRIVNMILKYDELCISDIELILDFTQTKTSRHLIYLKNSGLLGSRKKDQWVFYYLKDDVQEMTRQMFRFFEKDPLLTKDIETYEVLYSNRELAAYRLKQRKYS